MDEVHQMTSAHYIISLLKFATAMQKLYFRFFLVQWYMYW